MEAVRGHFCEAACSCDSAGEAQCEAVPYLLFINDNDSNDHGNNGDNRNPDDDIISCVSCAYCVYF